MPSQRGLLSRWVWGAASTRTGAQWGRGFNPWCVHTRVLTNSCHTWTRSEHPVSGEHTLSHQIIPGIRASPGPGKLGRRKPEKEAKRTRASAPARGLSTCRGPSVGVDRVCAGGRGVQGRLGHHGLPTSFFLSLSRSADGCGARPTCPSQASPRLLDFLFPCSHRCSPFSGAQAALLPAGFAGPL